jgi:hypothetical protein
MHACEGGALGFRLGTPVAPPPPEGARLNGTIRQASPQGPDFLSNCNGRNPAPLVPRKLRGICGEVVQL